MKSDGRVTYRYSSNFMTRKLLLLVSMFLVGWAILQILNYDTEDNVVTNTTDNTEQVEVESTPPTDDTTVEVAPEVVEEPEVVDEQPEVVEPVVEEEPGLPFTITSDIGEPTITGTGDNTVYAYNLSNGALIEVMTNSKSQKASDFDWTHRLGDSPSKLDIVDTPTEFCTPGVADCSAGNGVLEVNIIPTADSKHDYYVRIRDAIVHNRDTALDFYGPIIESLTLN